MTKSYSLYNIQLHSFCAQQLIKYPIPWLIPKLQDALLLNSLLPSKLPGCIVNGQVFSKIVIVDGIIIVWRQLFFPIFQHLKLLLKIEFLQVNNNLLIFLIQCKSQIYVCLFGLFVLYFKWSMESTAAHSKAQYKQAILPFFFP